MQQNATVIDRDEVERIKALLAYEILDTLPDPALDEITQLASTIAHSPYAFLGLADWSRVWFKSRIGFTTRQVELVGSPCQIVLAERQSILVGDAAADSRFAPGGIPLGEGIWCRSYAAAPLIDSFGAMLGLLGVASPQPQAFNSSTLETIEAMARQAITRMELYARGNQQERALRDRQQAERELTIERNFVAAILDATRAMVVVLDSDGRVVRVNRAGEQASGQSLENLAGRVFPEEIWPRKDRATAMEVFEAARSGKLPEPREIVCRTAAGKHRTISWSATTMAPGSSPDRSRRAASFVIMTGVDITGKIESEQQLRALMRQRESILESVEEGICGTDLDGRLSFVNPSGAAMLGYSRQELLGRDLHSLVHHTRSDGTAYPAEECPVLSSLREGTPVRVVSDSFWKKDGSSFAVEYAACPLIDGDEVRGTVLVFQNATKRHRLDRMKDEFISTVSHELRTPLTSLRAALGLVAGGALVDRPEKIPTMINLALNNCDRLVRLVNDIVDFERIQGGALPVQRAEVSVIRLFSRAIEAEQPGASRAGTTFRIDAQPVMVSVDEELVLKVLRKLIQNAVKFSERGGEILLSVARTGEADATIAVEDHGCGIRPEELTRIFDRFHQADSSDSRTSGGTGLGLAICKSIVHRHGGRIWVESSEGHGSTFFFTVPLARQHEEPSDAGDS